MASALLGGAALGVCQRLTGVEERHSVGLRSGSARSRHSIARVSRTPPVPLAVGAAQRVPRIGGDSQVAQDPLAVDVVVQPGTQPRPRAHQRRVRQLDGAVVAGQQPLCDEFFDQLLCLASAVSSRPRHPGTHRLAVDGRRHQAQQQVRSTTRCASGTCS